MDGVFYDDGEVAEMLAAAEARGYRRAMEDLHAKATEITAQSGADWRSKLLELTYFIHNKLTAEGGGKNG